jgi:uncharacterized cupin superfamily protein
MDVHPGVFVSSTATDGWEVDPEIGGGAEEHVLFDTGNMRAGMSRFTTRGLDDGHWVLPQHEVLLVLEGTVRIEVEGGPALDLKPGDMASLPKGTVTNWSFTLPFKEMWVLAGDRAAAAPEHRLPVSASSTSTDDWQPDPEIGETAEVHLLTGGFDTDPGTLQAGLSRFPRAELSAVDDRPWILPQTEVLLVLEGEATINIEGGPTLELGPGDMAALPKGAVTYWDVTTPFLEFWALADGH